MEQVESPYATPREVVSLADCYYYHTMNLPGIGVIPGEWDLRKGVCAYLGHVSVAGKRVLEVGTADGFLAFEMERQGAEVVALDISENEDWDIVPYGGHPSNAVRLERRNHIRRTNNAWGLPIGSWDREPIWCIAPRMPSRRQSAPWTSLHSEAFSCTCATPSWPYSEPPP